MGFIASGHMAIELGRVHVFVGDLNRHFARRLSLYGHAWGRGLRSMLCGFRLCHNYASEDALSFGNCAGGCACERTLSIRGPRLFYERLSVGTVERAAAVSV